MDHLLVVSAIGTLCYFVLSLGLSIIPWRRQAPWSTSLVAAAPMATLGRIFAGEHQIVILRCAFILWALAVLGHDQSPTLKVAATRSSSPGWHAFVLHVARIGSLGRVGAASRFFLALSL